MSYALIFNQPKYFINIKHSVAAPDLLFNTFPPFDYIFRANNLRLQKAENAEEEEEEEEDEEKVYTAIQFGAVYFSGFSTVQCSSMQCSAVQRSSVQRLEVH